MEGGFPTVGCPYHLFLNKDKNSLQNISLSLPYSFQGMNLCIEGTWVQN